MSYKDDLISLLCEAENIDTALEISEIIGEVKLRLQVRFWDQTHQKLLSILKREGLCGTWEVNTTFDRSNPTIKEIGLECRPKSAAGPSKKIRIALAVEKNRLSVGVRFETKQVEPFSPEINALTNALRNEGYKTDALDWWAGWKWIGDGINDDMSSKAFLVDMASAQALAVEKAAELMLGVIRDHSCDIRRVDAAM